MSEDASNTARVEPATMEDLPLLVELLSELFSAEADFLPDETKQRDGLRMILEHPNRGRIFVVRNDHTVIGMANVLITISTAVGGMVLLLEDVIIHPSHRGRGYGGQLLKRVEEFARSKHFKRITLLTDKMSEESQRFFQKYGYTFSHMIPMRLLLD